MKYTHDQYKAALAMKIQLEQEIEKLTEITRGYKNQQAKSRSDNFRKITNEQLNQKSKSNGTN